MQSLLEAVRAGDAEAVRALLADRPQLLRERPEGGPSAVLTAVYHGRWEVAELLVELGAPLDIFEATALGLGGRAAELLAEDPSLVNAFSSDGFQPLGLAAFFGRTELALLLLGRGAAVDTASRNAQRVMPLHSAVAARDLAVVRALLAAGAPVNAVQVGGFTPLHGAAQHGDAEMVESLLAAGADPAARTEEGRSPADLARAAGHEGLAARLAAS